MSQLPYGYQQYPQGQAIQQPVAPVQSPKFSGLPAGEHRRSLGAILLALWVLVAVNAVAAVCSTIQQVRAYQAQQDLDEAREKLNGLFKGLPISPRKS